MQRDTYIYNKVGAAMVLAATWLLAACTPSAPQQAERADQLPEIYPDYIGVTIPVDIAPLNFNAKDDDVSNLFVTAHGSKGGEIQASGSWADFDTDEWHRLTEQNKGGSISITTYMEKNGKWTQYRDFSIYVSPYALTDYGVTYRRIAPGYEVGGNIGIYQRDIHSFDESPILQESAVPGRCMNCHTANRTDPRQLTMQIRGAGGGTIIQTNGEQTWLNTKTDSTKAAGSYAYWHPTGNYCAYATSMVHQSFFVGTGQRIEAYHDFSDIIVLDVRSRQLILSPLLQTDDLEIFPAFSPDGKWLYYSTSKPCKVPAEYEKVKCSLCRIPFDAETGTFGTTADTLRNGSAEDMSFTLARPSYDGRWLMYCSSSRSNFPVFQPDADLWLMDLQTGSNRPLKEVNSSKSDSFHNWSSDSHWFVFSSKREDGMYAQLFFASIDHQGHVTKPFLLPQRNPKKFYQEMFDSYNCPDFTKTKVDFDARKAHRAVFADNHSQVSIR